jgi:hypothetical protein
MAETLGRPGRRRKPRCRRLAAHIASWPGRDRGSQPVEGRPRRPHLDPTTTGPDAGACRRRAGRWRRWRSSPCCHLAEQGQITERFTRAIDQLGSDHLDVRLGGIYALERIARDSPGNRSTIGEVLTAYIRGHAPWPPRLPDQPPIEAAIETVAFLRLRAPDVQAASRTLSGRGWWWSGSA